MPLDEKVPFDVAGQPQLGPQLLTVDYGRPDGRSRPPVVVVAPVAASATDTLLAQLLTEVQQLRMDLTYYHLDAQDRTVSARLARLWTRARARVRQWFTSGAKE